MRFYVVVFRFEFQGTMLTRHGLPTCTGEAVRGKTPWAFITAIMETPLFLGLGLNFGLGRRHRTTKFRSGSAWP